MDWGGCVEAAGRAVLELLEREWEPLSAAELDQRLDRAVEETLEAKLMEGLTAQPPAPAPGQDTVELRGFNNDTCGVPEPEEEYPKEDSERTTAVKYITDLLQRHDSRTRLSGRARLSLSRTVQLSLTLLSRRTSYSSVSGQFGLEKGNIYRIFFSFCERIHGMEQQLIRWPTGEEAKELLFPICILQEKDDDPENVPQVLGVSGHTKISLRRPKIKQKQNLAPDTKRLKQDALLDSWLNLELVCDRNGRFLHCEIKKASELDRGTSLREKMKKNPDMLPEGCCILARGGFPLTAQILTPYAHVNGPREELFNKTIETHFHIFDQAVAKLKTRFQRLRCLDITSFNRAKAVVLTACALHNVFLDLGEDFQAEIEEEEPLIEEEGELEDSGVDRRNAISDLLIKNVGSE